MDHASTLRYTRYVGLHRSGLVRVRASPSLQKAIDCSSLWGQICNDYLSQDLFGFGKTLLLYRQKPATATNSPSKLPEGTLTIWCCYNNICCPKYRKHHKTQSTLRALSKNQNHTYCCGVLFCHQQTQKWRFEIPQGKRGHANCLLAVSQVVKLQIKPGKQQLKTNKYGF